MFITEENHCISCYLSLCNTARLWCPSYITTLFDFFGLKLGAYENASPIYFSETRTLGVEHYITAILCTA